MKWPREKYPTAATAAAAAATTSAVLWHGPRKQLPLGPWLQQQWRLLHTKLHLGTILLLLLLLFLWTMDKGSNQWSEKKKNEKYCNSDYSNLFLFDAKKDLLVIWAPLFCLMSFCKRTQELGKVLKGIKEHRKERRMPRFLPPFSSLQSNNSQKITDVDLFVAKTVSSSIFMDFIFLTMYNNTNRYNVDRKNVQSLRKKYLETSFEQQVFLNLTWWFSLKKGRK